jgi:hypothetical protein
MRKIKFKFSTQIELIFSERNNVPKNGAKRERCSMLMFASYDFAYLQIKLTNTFTFLSTALFVQIVDSL